MKARLALFAVAVLALGALCGYLAAPKFHRPAGTPEQRLKERAVAYYQAMRRGDSQGMAAFKTPARQAYEEVILRKAADESAKRLKSNFSRQALDNMERGAQAVKPEDIKSQVEGKWALTWGISDVYDSGMPVAFPLDELVWVYDHGEWWEFEMRPRELNAYGNPPDFARNVLLRRQNEQVLEVTSSPNTSETKSTQPAGS